MRGLVLPIAMAFAAAACGGGQSSEPGTSVVPETLATTTVSETETAVPIPTISTIELSSRSFQMPSRNIGCILGDGVLVCDILSGLQPEPEGECELDWAGIELDSHGPPRPRCAGDTAYDRQAPVLHYDKAWVNGPFTCFSMTDGLQCYNPDGRGFLLSRAFWSQF